MKKRIFAFLLSFVMAVFQLPVFANEVDVEIDGSDVFTEVFNVVVVSDAEGYPGDTVSVTVDLEVDVAINTIGLSGLEFDEDILTFTGFSDYSELQSKSMLCQFDDAKMTGVAALSSAQKYSGNACTLNFVINDNAVAGESTAITFNNVQLKNGSNLYAYEVLAGNVTVKNDDPVVPDEPVSGNVVRVSDTSGFNGEEISVDVYFETEDKVNTIGISGLEFDEDILTFTGFSDYDEIKSQAMLCQFDDAKMTGVAALNSAKVYNGKVCTLNFVINDDAPTGYTTISFNNIQLKNGSVMYDYTVLSGSVMVNTDEVQIEYEGNCGDNVEWYYDGGVLNITGYGDIYDYSAEEDYTLNPTPWFELRDYITDIVISEGITRIGDYSLVGCVNMETIELPSTLTSIGERAFMDWINLVEIEIPESVTSIEDGAFEWNDNFERITIYNRETGFGSGVFVACPKLSIYGYESSTAKDYATSNDIDFVALYEEPVSGNVVEIENAAGAAGDEIAIAVFLNTEDKVNTIGLAGLDFDEDVLTFTGFSDYDYLQSKAMLCQFDEDKMTAVAAFTSAQTFDGQICVLNFVINDDAPSGETIVSFNDIQLKNSSIIYDSTVVGGVIEVEGEEDPVCENCGGAHEVEDCEEPVSENVFEIENVCAYTGEEIALAVYLSAEDEINTIGFAGLDYDEDVLTFTGFSDYDYLESEAILCRFDEDKVTGVAAFDPARTFEGQVCVLNFVVNKNAPAGQTTVSLNDLKLKNGAVSYESTVTGGVVDVYESEPDYDEYDGVYTFSTVSGAPGNIVSVDVYLETKAEFNTVGLAKITYDDDILEYVDYTPCESASQFFIYNLSENSSLVFSAATMSAINGFDDIIVTLNFRILDDAPTGSSAAITANPALKLNSTSYNTAVIDGLVEVCKGVSGVSLDESSLSLEKGGKYTLKATVTPADAYDQSVNWKSSNTSVVTVSNGVVTAVGSGKATVTVTTVDGGFTDECEVTVTSPVTGVSLNKSSMTLEKGKTETLVATVNPSDATNKNVTWTTSDKSVVTVDNGVVKAVGKGSATVTVETEDGGFTASCIVTVNVPVTGVSLNKKSLELTAGKYETLTATVTPADADDKSVTWKSSNTSVATVSSSGKVTAVDGGKATITVTTVDGSFTDTCEVTVIVPVTGISLDRTSMEVNRGDEYTLTATVVPANATNKNVTWTSSNEKVVNVTDGVVTAVGKGTAKVTATTVDGGFKAECTFNVSVPVTGVSLGHEEFDMYKGETYTLKAVVNPVDADDTSVTWSSSDETIATVENGVVTAVSGGSAQIIVKTTDGGFEDVCTVHVIVPVDSVTLNESLINLSKDETFTLVATVSPDDAYDKSVTWSSSDESVAKVDNGIVTAKGLGLAIITATSADGKQSAACAVRVNPKEPKAIYTLSDESAREGGTVTVTVELNTKETFNTLGLANITYDKEILTYSGYSIDESFAKKFMLCNFDEEKFIFSAATQTPFKGYEGEVLKLHFTVNEGAPLGATFVTAVAASVKLDSTEVVTSIDDAAINVIDEMLGDINLDEVVDMNDAIMLLQHSMFPTLLPIQYKGTVDFTGDGVVDMNDAIKLLQHSMFPDLLPLL